METQGCWFNDNFLISSNLQYLTNNVCSNKLLINKVNFTVDSSYNLVNEADLYKLYNCAGNYVREINVISLPSNCTYDFKNGLESSDYDEMLAAYLHLVENHCLNLSRENQSIHNINNISLYFSLRFWS